MAGMEGGGVNYIVCTGLGDRKPCQFHQLVEREGPNGHEVFIQRSSIFGGNCLREF